MPRIDLLHMLGDVPEGPWAIFSLPHGDGTDLVSVVVPRTLWLLLTRRNPFSSEMAIMEKVGTAAIEREMQNGEVAGPVFVQRTDVKELWEESEDPWFLQLRRCGQCGQLVPPGEVSEGLSNALPPNSRGEIELLVLCPHCLVQTPHRLTPFGLVF